MIVFVCVCAYRIYCLLYHIFHEYPKSKTGFQENKKNRQTRALTVTFCILSIKQIKLYVLYDGEQQARDVRF